MRFTRRLLNRSTLFNLIGSSLWLPAFVASPFVASPQHQTKKMITGLAVTLCLFVSIGVSQAGTVNSVLIAVADNTSNMTRLQAELRALGIPRVDLMDLRGRTPTLPELLPYDAVITWANGRYADSDAMGDVLADYVDNGKRVVIGNFAWWGSPYSLSGRIMDTGYSPFERTGNSLYRTACLGTYDSAHPIMAGVTSACDYFRDNVAVEPDATLVASWDDGYPLVAVNANFNVVGITSYPANGRLFTGDVTRIFFNAVTGDLQVDTDGDGVLNADDICPRGDDTVDSDVDGVPDDCDNCLGVLNTDQADMNENGIGDACDDTDSDGVMDDVDNCPTVFNPEQADLDNDGIGDVCDGDIDGDNFLNIPDNCPLTANPGQENNDGDDIGDVCDGDDDNDGVLDGDDNCPYNANANQSDIDGDDIGDVCDSDYDGDGIDNNVDNCPAVPNANQADMDTDGIGDVCDDSDNDGVMDDKDICPGGDDNIDSDLDGLPDFCDPCPNMINPVNVATTGIILTRNFENERDTAQFKLKNVAGIKAAAYQAVADGTSLTFRFGPCTDPVYSLTVPAEDLNVTYLNMRYTVGNLDVVRCVFSSEECVVNLHGDHDNDALDALLTGEMRVILEVGGTSYTNSGIWTQYDAGNGSWTKYRKDN